jgi:hypothetical protein
MTEKEPDRINRRPQIMNDDDQRQAMSKLRERAPIAAPKYLNLFDLDSDGRHGAVGRN